MGKAVIFAGSTSDGDHVRKITDKLQDLKVEFLIHFLSAHKSTRLVLDKVDEYNSEDGVVFITVAGKKVVEWLSKNGGCQCGCYSSGG